MKINELAVNSEVIEAGDWVGDIAVIGDIRIKTRGLSSAIYQQTKEKKEQALSLSLRANIPPDVERRIALESMVEACLLDWDNFTDHEGVPIPFSKERALSLLSDPDMWKLKVGCQIAANVVGARNTEYREGAAKNSATA